MTLTDAGASNSAGTAHPACPHSGNAAIVGGVHGGAGQAMSRAVIGVVGLGTATAAIARRLAGAGNRILVHDRQAVQRASLVVRGLAIENAGSLADIAAECREVILWRPDLDALKAVLFGDPDHLGLADELAPGALVIDLSPGSPAVPPRLQGALGSRAIALVDAAVLSGEPDDALAGNLEIALGGFAPLVDRAAAMLAPLGRIHRTGLLGTARSAGIVAAALRAVHRQAAIEVEELGRAAGLSAEAAAGLIALARHGGPQTCDPAAAAADATAAVELAAAVGIEVPLIRCASR